MARLALKALVAALLLAPLPLHAQQARVVQACGNLAPFGPNVPGGQALPTVDVTGKLCLSGGGSGGGITSLTANSTPTTGFTAGQLMMSDGTKLQAIAQPTSIATPTAGSPALQFAPSFYMYKDPNNNSTVDFTRDITSGSFYTWGGVAIQTLVPDVAVSSGGAFGWTPNAYLSTGLNPALWSDTLGVISDRSSTQANAFRVYNSFTDASNGEWGALDWQTTPNVLTIGTQANGTGSVRPMKLVGFGTNMDIGLTVAGWTTIGPLNLVSTVISVSPLNAPGVVSNGTQPTITGAGGACAVGSKVGGAMAGTVVLSAICASTNTIAFTGMPAVGNGYSCDAEDRTTRTAGPFIESATTATGFTLTVGATSSVAGDVLQWKCMGY